MKITLTNQAYDKIKSRLISGVIVPGQRLLYSKLAKELNMSTTPMREAIMKLASDGYLRLDSGRGAFAMQLDADHVAQMYELREALESYSIKRLIERGERSYLDQLHQCHQAMVMSISSLSGVVTVAQLEAFSQHDEQFHQTIVASAQSPVISKHAQECLSQLRLTMLQQQEVTVSTLKNVCEEHEQILIAIETGKELLARDALCAHILRSQQRALAQF